MPSTCSPTVLLLMSGKRRGLAIAPELATGDGALGFWKALREVYGTTREQRCWVHKTANVMAKYGSPVIAIGTPSAVKLGPRAQISQTDANGNQPERPTPLSVSTRSSMPQIRALQKACEIALAVGGFHAGLPAPCWLKRRCSCLVRGNQDSGHGGRRPTLCKRRSGLAWLTWSAARR